MLILLIITYLRRSGRLDGVLLLVDNMDRKKFIRFYRPVTVLLCMLMFSLQSSGNTLTRTSYFEESYPVPRGIANQLFYLQRNPDANTVIYQLNMKDGQLNEEEPVSVFWIRYTEGGQIKALSGMQRKLAYGISSKIIAKGKHELRFTSYPKLPLYLTQSAPGKNYYVYAVLKDRSMILDRVFIKVKNGTFCIPKVDYIQLSGKDMETGKGITHTITI